MPGGIEFLPGKVCKCSILPMGKSSVFVSSRFVFSGLLLHLHLQSGECPEQKWRLLPKPQREGDLQGEEREAERGGEGGGAEGGVETPKSLKVAGGPPERVEDNPLEINLYLILEENILKLGNVFLQ